MTSTDQDLLGVGQWANTDQNAKPHEHEGYQHAPSQKGSAGNKKRVTSSEPVERFLSEKHTESGTVLMWLGNRKRGQD